MKISSEKSMRVVNHIMKNRIINQYEVSKRTNVSRSYVNYILMNLRALNIVTRKSQFYYLNDPFKLLQMIGFERPFNQLKKYEFRLPSDTIQSSEQIILKYSEANEIRYAFTMFSGLRRYYEYHISYPLIHAYVDDITKFDAIQKGEGPIPVVLIQPDSCCILNNRKKVDNVYVCDDIQIIIDLFSSGIGRDAAYKYLNVINNER